VVMLCQLSYSPEIKLERRDSNPHVTTISGLAPTAHYGHVLTSQSLDYLYYTTENMIVKRSGVILGVFSAKIGDGHTFQNSS
jgi:hypothetical protein